MKYKKIVLLTSLLCCGTTLSFNHNSSEKIKYSDSAEELQTEVERFIYTGISVQKAKKILQDSSFTCGYYKNSSFAIEKRDRNGRIISPIDNDSGVVDYLSCEAHSLFGRRWQVNLVYKKNIVTLIHAMIFDINL
jgi:hypothetical protein